MQFRPSHGLDLAWLGSTKSFLTSVFHPANKDATDHQKKEEYAFRFMLLFVPFRSREDLQPDGGFYQNALRKAHEDGRITKDMIEIAENIQTIHNSLASRISQNSLSAETKLTETGAFENANGDDDDDDDNYEDLLASLGDLFLTLKNGDGLNTDSECLDIQFRNKQMEATSLSTTELQNAIDLSTSMRTTKETSNRSHIQLKGFAPQPTTQIRLL
jgi:hypothetical protein